jgi:N-acetylneuraminic acid mutarotase
MALTAKWKKVAEDDVLKRSSHAVAAIDGQVYVFGGELVARQPRDGEVHAVALDGGILKR